MGSVSRRIEFLLIYLISAVFIYAGIIKYVRPDLLLVDIQSYNILPHRLAYFGAFLLPPVEIVAGIGVIYARYRKVAAGTLFFLTVIFIVALSSAWIRGLDISCGCFGKHKLEVNYPWLIFRDLVIASLSLRLCLSNKTQGSRPKGSNAKS